MAEDILNAAKLEHEVVQLEEVIDDLLRAHVSMAFAFGKLWDIHQNIEA